MGTCSCFNSPQFVQRKVEEQKIMSSIEKPSSKNGKLILKDSERAEEVDSWDKKEEVVEIEEEEIKIEEVNMDFITMNSLNKIKKGSLSAEKFLNGGVGVSNSTDVVEFSSLRESNHQLFTAENKVKLGKVRIENGCIYEGEWLKGLRSGLGVLTWPNGAFYNVKPFHIGRMAE